MQYDDERFENYLREFKPRQPQPLPAVSRKKFGLRRLAAAAAVLIAFSAASWFALHNHQRRIAVRVVSKPGRPLEGSFVKPKLLQLTRMAVEDPRKLDAELAEESRRILPDFRSKESTLRVLAKE